MNNLIFLSGNTNKISEVQAIAADFGLELKGIQIPDMPPEIQGTFEEIIRHKILSAVERGNQRGLVKEGDIIIAEDSGMEIDMFGGMPGPYAKHFFESKEGGISYDDFIQLFPNQKITVRCLTVAGCMPDINNSDSCFFEIGEMKGYLVAKRGENGFGWDPYFVPTEAEGIAMNPDQKTIGEMTITEKNQISTRSMAVRKIFKRFS